MSLVSPIRMFIARRWQMDLALTNPGYDWYVDSVNGNDANTGRSAAQAFQTIAALEAAGISADDKIGLHWDSHWREQLDIAVNNVTVQAYGSGTNRPILDASDVAPNASFAATGGTANVYEISVTPEWGASNWLNVWEDDIVLTRASSVANCDATPGSCYPSGGAGAITLYVHASDSSDVTTNGKVYEYTQRGYGLKAQDQSNISVTSIETRRNLDANGSLRCGRYAGITDCIARDGNKHNLFVSDGSIIQDTQALNAYNGADTSTMFIFNENTPISAGIQYNNCTASLDALNAKVSGFSGHRNTSGDFGTVTFINCTAVNCGVGGHVSDCAAVLQNFTFTNCTFGWRVDNVSNTSLNVNGGTFSTNRPNARAISCTVVTLLTINGLTATIGAGVNGGTIFISAALTASITNCSFVNNSSGGSKRAIYCDDAGASLTLTNNEYSGSVNWHQIYLLNPEPTWASDYNTFGPNFVMNIGGMPYGDLPTFQAATGQDTHSV